MMAPSRAHTGSLRSPATPSQRHHRRDCQCDWLRRRGSTFNFKFKFGRVAQLPNSVTVNFKFTVAGLELNLNSKNFTVALQ